MIIEDIGAIMEASGIGTVGTDIFFDRLPETIPNAIGIFTTGGFPLAVRTEDIKPTFQIRVRNKDYATAHATMISIYNLFDSTTQMLISPSGRKMIFRALMPPMLLLVDEAERVNFVLNISVVTNRD